MTKYRIIESVNELGEKAYFPQKKSLLGWRYFLSWQNGSATQSVYSNLEDARERIERAKKASLRKQRTETIVWSE